MSVHSSVTVTSSAGLSLFLFLTFGEHVYAFLLGRTLGKTLQEQGVVRGRYT
jgi:hypothetical protein